MPKSSSKPRKKSFTKFKLLFDENMALPRDMPRLNNRFNIKHVVQDYKSESITDIEVYDLAKREKRLVITFNVKHFKELAVLNKNFGIIGISPNLSTEQIDKKLTALLMKSTKNQLFGKFNQISSDSTPSNPSQQSFFS